jgi:hypothetical protein
MTTLQPKSPALADAQMSTTCVVCQKPIVDGQWFCRVPQKNDRVADAQGTKLLLCSPGCAYRYFSFADVGLSQI